LVKKRRKLRPEAFLVAVFTGVVLGTGVVSAVGAPAFTSAIAFSSFLWSLYFFDF
jgi:hypothetical protein